MTAVVGRQLVDAGDQELSLLIARFPLAARGLVVVVQSCGLSGSGAYHGDGHVEPFGERVDGGRAWRPDQVPCGGEGIDRGPGQAAAAGDLSVRPAAVAKPFLDQALQWIDRTLWGSRVGFRSLPGKIRPAIRSVRRHTYQPNPCWCLEGQLRFSRWTPVTSAVAPVLSTVTGALAPVTRTLTPVVSTLTGALAPVTGTVTPLLTTVTGAASSVLGTVPPVLATGTPALGPVSGSPAGTASGSLPAVAQSLQSGNPAAPGTMLPGGSWWQPPGTGGSPASSLSLLPRVPIAPGGEPGRCPEWRRCRWLRRR